MKVESVMSARAPTTTRAPPKACRLLPSQERAYRISTPVAMLFMNWQASIDTRPASTATHEPPSCATEPPWNEPCDSWELLENTQHQIVVSPETRTAVVVSPK